MSRFLPITSEEVDPLIPKRSLVADTVGEHYVLDYATPLPELQSEFTIAYALKEGGKQQSGNLYALVFNNSMPARLEVLHKLLTNECSSISMPMAAEITYITPLKQELLTIIIERPPALPLSHMVMTNPGIFSEEFIRNNIITPIARLLEKFSLLDLSHGRIHPDHIYMDPNGYVVVGECLSEPSGYSQDPIYEPAERAMSLSIAKGDSTVSDDYYALGVLVVYLLSGSTPLASVNPDELIYTKLSTGTFNAMVEHLHTILSPSMHDLLVGLLSDHRKDRWNDAKLAMWLKGKQYNLMRPSPFIEGTRSISFSGKNHFNRRSLAYWLYKHWQEAKRFLRDEHVIKWLEGSVGAMDLATQIKQVLKSTSSENRRSVFDTNDELVARTILALDPEGPLRIAETAVHINAIGVALAYSIFQDVKELTQLLRNIINSGLLNAAISMQNSEEGGRLSNWAWIFDKTSVHINKPHIGFGTERCLYDLNPFLPCQSPIVKKHYVLSTETLLDTLDQIAETFKQDDVLIDRHIAAYLARHIRMQTELRIKTLSPFPDLAVNTHLQKLTMIVTALRKTPGKQYKGIASYFYNHLENILNTLHSRKIREEKKQTLARLCKEGKLMLVLKLMCLPTHYARDQIGFKDARRQFIQIYQRKMLLKNNSHVNNSGFRYGLHISVIIAYLLCALEILYLVATNM